MKSDLILFVVKVVLCAFVFLALCLCGTCYKYINLRQQYELVAVNDETTTNTSSSVTVSTVRRREVERPELEMNDLSIEI